MNKKILPFFYPFFCKEIYVQKKKFIEEKSNILYKIPKEQIMSSRSKVYCIVLRLRTNNVLILLAEM